MYCSFCGGNTKLHLNAGHFQIVKCIKCGIAFTQPSPILPKYELLDFHNESTENNIGEIKQLSNLPSQWQTLIRLQVEMVCKYVKLGGKILEIGCGDGLLLLEIQKNGYIVKGVEPSKSAVKRAILRELDVSVGYFEKQAIEDKYDIVIMSQVLEHIEDPQKMIGDIFQILNDGGGLMITQTNYRGILPHILKEKWYAWVPEQHFWHFTPSGLTNWLKRYNFNLKKIKYLSLVYPDTIKHRFFNLLSPIIGNLKDQFILLVQKK